MKKVLICEFWGLGDAVLATSAIQRFLNEGYEVSVFCTGGSQALLKRSYPDLNYLQADLPWKVFKKKYHFWNWNWVSLLKLIWILLLRKDDVVMSVRPDPRDHFLMWVSGCRKRYGVKRGRYGFSLTGALEQTHRHRVEDWNDLCNMALEKEGEIKEPSLMLADRGVGKKIVFHVGARIEVRRLDLKIYRGLCAEARKRGFEIHLIADPDGYGAELREDADHFYDQISLEELQDIFKGVAGFIGNDSAPAHIAAAMGLPVLAFFGPTSVEWFRPWAEEVTIVQDNVCPFRPCFDMCRFETAVCMDCLTHERVFPDFERFMNRLENNKK